MNVLNRVKLAGDCRQCKQTDTFKSVGMLNGLQSMVNILLLTEIAVFIHEVCSLPDIN